MLTKYYQSPNFWRNTAIAIASLFVLSNVFSVRVGLQPGVARLFSPSSLSVAPPLSSALAGSVNDYSSEVLPASGVQLPVEWGDLGQKMVIDGVIDEQKFRSLFEGGLSAEEEQMLTGQYDQQPTLNAENSRYILNMLWAFGLANKNAILEEGEMVDPQYGGNPGGFASTGGWTLSRGEPMDHYSQHTYVSLTSEQQDMVARVAKGIYRPCCGNSTHFPDCNHGMAMLGLLQLMAANGVDEEQMYQVALLVNSYWFPQTYLDIAAYFAERGISWSQVDPKVALSAEYSSAQGYQSIRAQIENIPQPAAGGGGCGV